MKSMLHIIANGTRTPLGLRSAASAAAIRAGISGMGEHPFMIDQSGDPMPGVLDSELDPALMGPERLLALGETALREACEPLGALHPIRLSLPVYVGLPEFRPGFTKQDAEAVRTGLSRIEGLPIEISGVTAFAQGHASGLLAIENAIEQMRQGAFEACLVGGVDSYFNPDTMEWLDANRQLVGAVSRSGFVPGEGAAFCLLMTDRTRNKLGLKSLACILACASAHEVKLIKTSAICLGEGLTSAVRDAARVLSQPSEKINTVICDINGERYRGEEWGFVCLRMPHCFDDPTAYDSPADCWGDMGAASGPLFAMLACQAATRGYAKGPRTLLWASSECGVRATTVLQTSTFDKMSPL
jgi:3-oxoacyl-[acyl-carrier-protein] synthase-1